jgi:PAS domain S-box-containing protein
MINAHRAGKNLIDELESPRMHESGFEKLGDGYERLEERLSETNARLQVLQQVTASVHSTMDLDEVFKQITDGAVYSLGYTTAFVMMIDNEKKCFQVRALSTQKRLLHHISKVLGFSLTNLSVPTGYDSNANVKSVLEGRTVITKNVADIACPLISKKACSALEKLGETKNCILVPLTVGEDVVGAVFITSSREEVSQGELTTLQNFAHAASQAIGNANLHTQVKLVEETLRQSEENLKTYLESAPDGVYISDLKGTFLYGNKKAEELTGYEREELIGNSFLKLKLLLAKDLVEAGKLLALNAMRRPTGPDEFELMRKDGSHIWVEINTTPIKQGKKVMVIGSVRDITERKRVEEKLRANERELETLLYFLPGIVFYKDTNDHLLRCNHNFALSLGKSYKEVVGKTTDELFPKQAEDMKGDDREVIESGLPKMGIIEPFDTPWGSRWTQTSKMPVQDDKGNVVGLIGIASDITELLKAEEEKRQLEHKAQLSSRLASIGEMASGIAHEINNPLTGVIGFAELLMARKDIPDDVRKDLEIIDDGARRTSEIVRRLLTFARQDKAERNYVNINEIIETTLRLRAYEMETGNIKVKTYLDPDLPKTMAAGGQLQQVFLNLIINAESEMKRAHGKGNMLIRTERKDNTIRISFTDDGHGIPKENLERIFDPFFTTKKVDEGTGLGLSVCYGIVTDHNGRIYAKNEKGKGATFIVELPIVTKESPLGATEPYVEKPKKVAKSRILVIDDELGVREFLSRLLTDEGHEVETVDNARDALEKIEKERYNLILLDIKMPDISGIEVYQRAREIAQSLARRVVFITGDVMAPDTKNFLFKSKASYITKPFDPKLLKNEIERILSEG